MDSGVHPCKRGSPMRMKASDNPALTLAMLLASTAFFASTPLAQESRTNVGTDIGTLYKEEVVPLYKPPSYSPYAGHNYPTRVLWGDTHLHTANSLDAAAFGNTLGPEQAYRFARGEEVVSASGQQVRLSRPLDFLVVADHAEGLGGMLELKKGNPLMMADQTLRRWHEMVVAGGQTAVDATIELIRSTVTRTPPPLLLDQRVVRSVWQGYTETADRYNEPGRF